VKDTLFCPYCYTAIAAKEIRFRCSGRASKIGGPACSPEIDPVLRERTGYTVPSGRIFGADGRATKAVCPDCKNESTARICPACHTVLPVHFGSVNSRLIALVGAKETGKSVFMTVLVHEMMNRIGRRFDAAMAGADDNTRRMFVGNYEDTLYRKKELLAGTARAAAKGQDPLVFRFVTEEPRKFGKPVPRHTLLSFFDTAGEDLTTAESVRENVRYLTAADGIVLLLDPLQMSGARTRAKPGTKMPGTLGSQVDDPASVLERITDLVSTVDGGPNKKISKPLAVAFTKMDALDHELKEVSPLRRPAPETPYFDETDSQEVHAEIQRLLDRWDGSRIDQITSKHYQNYRYFGLSALGESPSHDNKIAGSGIRPYRVADPFLWELSGFGAIKLQKGA
jgi:hypothetical protein